MEKINGKNVIKSFFLGLFIGVILQAYDPANLSIFDRVVSVLASGIVGFVIGFITEGLTARLPIRIANARTYFFINNLIALVVTAVIVGFLILIPNRALENQGQWLPVILTVLGIVCAANALDYWMYRRTQAKLESFKAGMREK
ncbi:hypothetical protein [Cohnella sp.]|uniref:hypothetical protein n=1 Tax=Cohnella sp. TaxID=1883426 RepID=UPI003562A7AA